MPARMSISTSVGWQTSRRNMLDDRRRRQVSLYEDLFDAISENKRIEVGLKTVLEMGADKCDPAIREMAQAVLEEIAFFRQRMQGRLTIFSSPPRGTINAQHAVQLENTGGKICDPILLEMAQAVLVEMQHVRNQRDMQRRCGYVFLPIFVIFFLIVVCCMIFGVTQLFHHFNSK